MPDLRAGPPARFRVVERDRRLIVVDAASGEPARSTPDGERPSLLSRRSDISGSATLVTRRWYDTKAPRTLRLDLGSAALIANARWFALGLVVLIAIVGILAPILLIPLAIGFAQFGKAGRRLATRWLDRIERETGG